MEIWLIIVIMGLLVVALLIRQGILIFHRFQHSAKVVIELMEDIQEEQPIRQIQNLTNTYEGLIRRDFPEFDAKEFLQLAESVLLNILNSLEEGRIHHEEHLTDSLKNTLHEQIRDLQSQKEKIYFDSIHIHKSAISRYTKNAGSRVISVEIAIEYATRKEKEQKRVQYKYILEAIYVQDLSKVGNLSMVGHHCPNCGAPVIELGKNKLCRYCGAGLTEINMRIWRFNSYKKA